MTIIYLLLTLLTPQASDIFMVENGKKSERPSLVFINGLAQDTVLWQDLIDRMEKKWHCVRFDFPGIGKTPSSEKPLTLDQMAEICVEVIKEKELHKVHIIGLSLGSFTAQTLAAKHPELIETLTLIGTTMGGYNHIPPTAEALSFLMGQSGLEGEAKFRKGLELSLSKSFCESYPERFEKILNHVSERKIDQKALTQQVFAGMSFDITRLVPFKGKTLIIHGKEDQLIPFANAQKLHEHLSQSKLVLLDQSGHICNIDQVEKVAETLESFLMK